MNHDPAQNPYTASQVDGGGSNGNAFLKGSVRTGQIITFALVQGVVVVTAIMVWMVLSGMENDDPVFSVTDDSQIMLVVGVGAAVLCLVASFLYGTLARSSAQARFSASGEPWDARGTDSSPMPPAAKRLVGEFQTRTLVGQALLDGAAVINAIFILINENLLHLAPILILTIGIAMQVPTLGKIQRWIEDAQVR